MFSHKIDFDSFKKPLKKARHLEFRDMRLKDLMHNIDMRELGNMLNPSLVATVWRNRMARRYVAGGVIAIAAAAALTAYLRDRAEKRQQQAEPKLVPHEKDGRTVYSIAPAPKKTA